MIICLCRNVSDRDIARSVESGCNDFIALQRNLGVATACGVCREFAEDAFNDHSAQACRSCADAVRCGATPLPAEV